MVGIFRVHCKSSLGTRIRVDLEVYRIHLFNFFDLIEFRSNICTKLDPHVVIKRGSSAPFFCSVEIGDIQYIGAAATTKREAQIKAAHTALLAIQGQENAKNSASQYTVLPTRKKNNMK
ncbi:double-stranded RNA-binding protein 8-like protein [Carex littledalei]|uniref:Double-stranded RNA-binding protein 8-like protein n=1 Tax=Carex littledalei TaxID=544730 RepID=A0A833RFG2_9POAL|nr:double-stranded RNA-binding protein 8-like protein [Carex littledalei]